MKPKPILARPVIGFEEKFCTCRNCDLPECSFDIEILEIENNAILNLTEHEN